MSGSKKKKTGRIPAKAEKTPKTEEFEDLFLEEDQKKTEKTDIKKRSSSKKKHKEASEPDKGAADAKSTAKADDDLSDEADAPDKRKTTKGKTSHKRKAIRRKKRERAVYACISAALVFLLMLTAVICVQKVRAYSEFSGMKDYLDTDAFYPGMCVDGIDLGGKTLQEALDMFRDKAEKNAEETGVTFVCDGTEYTYGAKDIGFGSNYRQVVLGAWQKGRRGSLESRYMSALSGCEYTVSYGYNEEKLRAITDDLAASLSEEAVDAYVSEFKANKGEFVFSEGKNGRIVDADQLYAQALSAVEGGDRVDVAYTEVKADVTKEDLASSYGIISSAITNASSSTANRLSNIKQACLAISTVCLKPGEEFSFNETVGRRTVDRGYKKAGVFISGELGEEIGGGICQVATTLFNAAVKADLEITERHPHSRPVAYVDKGKDATVSWRIQDLKFVNTRKDPVYLVAFVNKNKRVEVMIFGKKPTDGITISLYPVIVETIPEKPTQYEYTDELPTGEQKVKSDGRKGYKVNTYKVKTDAKGNVLSKEFLCYSSYPAGAEVIQIGR